MKSPKLFRPVRIGDVVLFDFHRMVYAIDNRLILHRCSCEESEMEKVIAFCGITCSDCPTFNATKNNDNVERKRVADLWTKQYGHEFKMEDINCEGCLTRGPRVFSYCNICEIRKCGQEKNMRNCAYCADYKCEKLSKLHEQAPKAKETLDAIHRNK